MYSKRWTRKGAKFSLWYFVISGLYAVVGGVIAIILPAVNYFAAFYVGVTWPTLISTLLHHRGPHELMASKPPKAIKHSKVPKRSLIGLLRDHADLFY